MRATNGWRRAAVLPLVAGVLTLAACGDPTGASTSGGRPGLAMSDELRSCLAENGVTLPEPGEGGEPPDGGAGSGAGAPPSGAAIPPDGATPPDGSSPEGGAGAQPADGSRGIPPGVDAATWAAAQQACAEVA